MTAILKDLRSLKAARDRGEITSAQYARAERVLHEMVEEAVVDVDADAAPTPKPSDNPARRPNRPSVNRRPEPARPPSLATPAQAWETVLMVVAGLACATMLIAVLIGSLTLALTLLVTMIAAGSIWALRHLDE